MDQWAKAFVLQAWRPEYGPCDPCKDGKRKCTQLLHVCRGMCMPIRTYMHVSMHTHTIITQKSGRECRNVLYSVIHENNPFSRENMTLKGSFLADLATISKVVGIS